MFLEENTLCCLNFNKQKKDYYFIIQLNMSLIDIIYEIIFNIKIFICIRRYPKADKRCSNYTCVQI